MEVFVGTNRYDACSGPGQDAWPPDISRDTWVNGTDILYFKGHISAAEGDPLYSRRLDLYADHLVSSLDILVVRRYIGLNCTP